MQGFFNEVALDLVGAGRAALPVLVNAVERRDEEGNVRFIRVTVFNASDRRRYERELLEARRAAETASTALRELNQTLEARVTEAVERRMEAEEALRQAQKMEAIGQLTGGIAHDFNNLLTGIAGSLELLQTRIGQGRMQRPRPVYHRGQGAAKRAAALTHRLLAFARRQALDPKPVDVNRLVAGMEELVRRTHGAEHRDRGGAARPGCGRRWSIRTSSRTRCSTCASTRATRCPRGAADDRDGEQVAGRARRRASATCRRANMCRSASPTPGRACRRR